MTNPTLTNAHHQLARLVGTWTGEEQMFPSPWLPEGGTHGVFAHDPVRDNIGMHWFDSMGPTPNIYKGSFDGDTLNMTMKMSEGWSRASFELTSPDSYTFGMDVSQDGKNWASMIKGSYTRKG